MNATKLREFIRFLQKRDILAIVDDESKALGEPGNTFRPIRWLRDSYLALGIASERSLIEFSERKESCFTKLCASDYHVCMCGG